MQKYTRLPALDLYGESNNSTLGTHARPYTDTANAFCLGSQNMIETRLKVRRVQALNFEYSDHAETATPKVTT